MFGDWYAHNMYKEGSDQYRCHCRKYGHPSKFGFKDIIPLWQAEAKRHGLPFGLSEHLGMSYTWMSASHGADKEGPYAGVPYDGADPANQSLYRDNDSEPVRTAEGWHLYTDNPKYHEDWFNRITDVIDKFQPDLLYSDGEVPFRSIGYAMVAHLYNTSTAAHGGRNNAVYTFKQHIARNTDPGVTEIGVFDIECGLSAEPSLAPGKTIQVWATGSTT